MSSDFTEINEIIAGRFRSERLRLDLTHSDVARLTGYSRNSVVTWEKGAAIPSAVLSFVYDSGFDLQFVCIV